MRATDAGPCRGLARDWPSGLRYRRNGSQSPTGLAGAASARHVSRNQPPSCGARPSVSMRAFVQSVRAASRAAFPARRAAAAREAPRPAKANRYERRWPIVVRPRGLAAVPGGATLLLTVELIAIALRTRAPPIETPRVGRQPTGAHSGCGNGVNAGNSRPAEHDARNRRDLPLLSPRSRVTNGRTSAPIRSWKSAASTSGPSRRRTDRAARSGSGRGEAAVDLHSPGPRGQRRRCRPVRPLAGRLDREENELGPSPEGALFDHAPVIPVPGRRITATSFAAPACLRGEATASAVAPRR